VDRGDRRLTTASSARENYRADTGGGGGCVERPKQPGGARCPECLKAIMLGAAEKNAFFAPFLYFKNGLLKPRQARDTHREALTNREVRFPQATWSTSSWPAAHARTSTVRKGKKKQRRCWRRRVWVLCCIGLYIDLYVYVGLYVYIYTFIYMVLLPRQARDKHIGESLICINNTSTVYAPGFDCSCSCASPVVRTQRRKRERFSALDLSRQARDVRASRWPLFSCFVFSLRCFAGHRAIRRARRRLPVRTTSF
jgi:hypothetical protein